MNRVVVTDAYSASNLGDLELVQATVDHVVCRAGGKVEDLVVLAAEPHSFANRLGIAVKPKLFSREIYVASRRLARLTWLARWGVVILAYSLAPRRGFCIADRLLSDDQRSTLETLKSCDMAVAVGGGYLGDRYLKESFLTMWTWWWLGRQHKPVETMPLSIEAQGQAMRLLLRLGSRVQWRVRDQASLDVLRRSGLEGSLFPDLAFRSTRLERLETDNGSVAEPAIVIVPVGSDYFERAVWEGQLASVVQALKGQGRPHITPRPAQSSSNQNHPQVDQRPSPSSRHGAFLHTLSTQQASQTRGPQSRRACGLI